MNRVTRLSINIVVGVCCSYPNCCSIDLIYNIVFPVSAAAVNSASVDDSATVCWGFYLYATIVVPPAKNVVCYSYH